MGRAGDFRGSALAARTVLPDVCARYALLRTDASTMIRTLTLAAVCAALSACVGVPKVRPVHDRGICVQAERADGDLLTMQLCNCSGRPIRLEQSQVPWSALGRSGFRLTFHGESIPTREPGFTDDMPFSFYQIPAGECLDGHVRLEETFLIGGRDLRATGWVLRWSGTIDGDGESWALDFGSEF